MLDYWKWKIVNGDTCLNKDDKEGAGLLEKAWYEEVAGLLKKWKFDYWKIRNVHENTWVKNIKRVLG